MDLRHVLPGDFGYLRTPLSFGPSARWSIWASRLPGEGVLRVELYSMTVIVGVPDPAPRGSPPPAYTSQAVGTCRAVQYASIW